ncbi:ATP-binding cassette domain-containing protein [Tardiphaga sp.]|jgi:branched-chain amino acid transport system permease protein|uniref:branched-chain amino acid ABC transporter ATP-binding protein/permease n=1 Tax=Tardiphaga sp. TaxID=1926292 RepID=UPI0037D9D0A2
MRKLIIPLACVALLALPAVVPNDYLMRLVNVGIIYAILAVSLNFVLGYAGQISLGHAGFFGIGAYTAGILTHTGPGYMFWPVFVLAGGMAGLAGLIIGVPALRLKGHYLAFGTLGFGEIIRIILFNWQEVTHGGDGIAAIPAPSVFGFQFDNDQKYFYLSLAFLLLVLLLARRTETSKYGRSFAALRDAEMAAGTTGVNVTRIKILAFVISSVIAGCAGSLYAHLVGFISPDAFTFEVTAQVLSMVLLGGMGTTFGPVLGAAFITMLPEMLRISKEYYQVIYGAGVAFAVVFLPQGILGFLSRRKAVKVPQLGENGVIEELALDDPAIDLLRPKSGSGAGDDVLLSIKNLTCRFGGLIAINDLSMQVRSGTIHALIGPNGAGKSTFINLVSGVYQRQEGVMEFGGQVLPVSSSWNIAKAGIARTFQNLRSFHSLTVMDNVLVGCRSAKPASWSSVMLGSSAAAREETDLRATAEAALRFVGLWAMRDIPVSALPHELQRMVEIARALAMRPRMILLDEPAAGMNPTEVERLVVQVRKMKAIGLTVLIVEHNMPFVMKIADTITVLNFGKKIADGTPVQIQQNPEVIGAYLGKRAAAKEVKNAVA